MIRSLKNSLCALSAVALVVVSLTASPATGAVVLDQEAAAAGGTVTNDPSLEWQQSFKQVNNNITHASIYLPFGTGDITLEILDGVCGNVMASASATGTGWVQVDFGGPVSLVPEQTYFLKATSTVVMGSTGIDLSYLRGALHYSACVVWVQDTDLMFRTYAEDQYGTVPVEESTWGSIKSLFR